MNKASQNMQTDTESSSFKLQQQTCQRFTLTQIQGMTQNFDDALLIGSGGFGKVYKCPTSDLAIKRLKAESRQGAQEFWAEIETLTKLRHCNLVSLIGYCDDGNEMVLVYEFMPNGTLEDHLHKVGTSLSWLQLLKICIGAARGLDYLHTGTGTQNGVIHRDVKSSNILLDANFAAKISDFGLAKTGPINQTHTHVSTRVKGTYGYMDPCYISSGKLTRKSDVYSFGVVLLEVLCGRQATGVIPNEDYWGLTTWAQNQIKKGKLNQIIDPTLREQISTNCSRVFARIACRCLDTDPKRRPTMADVVAKLESVLSLQGSINSRADTGTLVEKVWTLFSARTKLTADRAAGSKAELGDEVGNKLVDAPIVESSNRSLKIFTYAELENATSYFKYRECHTDSLTTAYKGWVDKKTYAPAKFGVGLEILVGKKRIGNIKMDLRLEDFNQSNLTKLLGYCLRREELFFVYEFIPSKSLDRYLYEGNITNPLSWVQRLKIAEGAAQGLFYLHRRKHMAYTQFKTSVVLLDADLNAKLTDFELDKSWLVENSYLFNNDAFYAAPEWFSYQVAKLDGIREASLSKVDYFSVKSEIYAFGVVLLEILTGQKVYDVTRPEGKQNLVKWMSPLLADKKNLGMIMDPKLQHNYSPDGAFRLTLLVSKCLQHIEEKRPSMEAILQVLLTAIKM